MKFSRVLCGLALLAFYAAAQPVAQLPAPTAYVNDFAKAITPQVSEQIEDLCRQIDEKAHAQIALVTVNTLAGRDVETYAVDLFKKWGVGSKSTNRGVLILYVIQDHRARIEVGYGLESILPDGKIGSFQREAVPQMRSGDYSGALLLVTSRVAQVIAQDAGVQLNGAFQPAAPLPTDDQPGFGFTPIWIIAIILLVLFTPLRRVLFWLLLSQMFGGGRPGRHFGGGGFGGGGFGGFGGGSFGGGGGFGGFGGGSSGGGGASSSW